MRQIHGVYPKSDSKTSNMARRFPLLYSAWPQGGVHRRVRKVHVEAVFSHLEGHLMKRLAYCAVVLAAAAIVLAAVGRAKAEMLDVTEFGGTFDRIDVPGDGSTF
jgi:hypothetical protein